MMDWYESSAPGRLDIMGGIADYSGSLVLQMPIRQKTTVRVALRTDYQCIIKSYLFHYEKLEVRADYRNFLKPDGEIDYAYANSKFRQLGKDSWIAYVLGCVLVLQREKGISFQGASIEIQSDVPLGKGVSSSASLEMATMKALSTAFDLSFTGTELAVLAQRAENYVAGAPCGLMDQLSTGFGVPGKLLPIVCQPDRLLQPVSVPDGVSFIGLDSGVKHSVAASGYSQVRCAAFMGYSIIAHSLGITRDELHEVRKSNNRSRLPFEGYLCNISVDEFESRFRKLLPDSLVGKDFLEQYGVTIDNVTEAEAGTEYKVARCTAHPIYENSRVHCFREKVLQISTLPQSKEREGILYNMGVLMYQSHESYSRCGLGSEQTDEIVRLAAQCNGIYGARITGGGQGGTVCLMVGEEGKGAVEKLHHQLCEKYNQKLELIN